MYRASLLLVGLRHTAKRHAPCCRYPLRSFALTISAALAITLSPSGSTVLGPQRSASLKAAASALWATASRVGLVTLLALHSTRLRGSYVCNGSTTFPPFHPRAAAKPPCRVYRNPRSNRVNHPTGWPGPPSTFPRASVIPSPLVYPGGIPPGLHSGVTYTQFQAFFDKSRVFFDFWFQHDGVMTVSLKTGFLAQKQPYSTLAQNLFKMAKVKFSALISDMRNKLNGSVFSKNRAGAFLRNKVTPSNPQTVAQNAARALLTSFSQGWRALTDAQRQAWNTAVSDWATTDIFGDIKNPTGLQLYVKVNTNITNAGGTPVSDPPLKVGVSAVDSISVAAAAGAGTMTATFAPSPVPADTTLYIEATEQLSPGINNATSRFRAVSTVAAAGTSPANIFAAYTAKFGSLIEGKKVFVRVKFINKLTGEVSQPLTASTLVAA